MKTHKHSNSDSRLSPSLNLWENNLCFASRLSTKCVAFNILSISACLYSYTRSTVMSSNAKVSYALQQLKWARRENNIKYRRKKEHSDRRVVLCLGLFTFQLPACRKTDRQTDTQTVES